MAVSPPFTIAETLPAVTDLVSQFPPVENTYRDVVESWLTQLSDPTTGLLKPTAFAVPFELESTDAGATIGPTISLYRNSASPAVNDAMGGLLFYGEDSAGNKELYGQIYSVIDDPISTSEDGSIRFNISIAGVATQALSVGATVLSNRPFTGASNITAGANLIAVGVVTSGQVFNTSGSSVILAPGSAGTSYIRPNGFASGSGETQFLTTGDILSAARVIVQPTLTSLSGGLIVAANGGALFFRPNSDISGAGQCTIDTGGNFVAAGNVTAFSDRNLKKDIEALTDVGYLFDIISPVRYKMKSNDQPGIGFIAQDFEGHLDELIFRGPINLDGGLGPLSLAYANLTAVLWREVQDLRGRVKTLELKPVQVTL